MMRPLWPSHRERCYGHVPAARLSSRRSSLKMVRWTILFALGQTAAHPRQHASHARGRKSRPSFNSFFCADDRGTSALEFAIVGPIFLLFMIGLTYTCLLLFTQASMQYAVEAGARCASIQTNVCTSSSTIVSYTRANYLGPIVAPSFAYSTPACGHQVSSTTSFDFDLRWLRVTLPLSATACYP